MHTHGNWWTVGQGQENLDKTINFSFEVFNADRTKNREVTKMASLEIKINRYKKQLEAIVMNLNGMDMFWDTVG